MSSKGWIKLPRAVIDRPWFRDRDGKTLRLYIFLAVSAYSQDQEYQGTKVRRGSCPITRAQMQEGTGLSYQSVDSSLKRLQRLGEIILKANNRFTVVTLCNYEGIAQENSLFTNQTDNQQTTNRLPADAPADNTPINNKNKEYRNNNLISLNKPYKKERESVAYEIKKIYNNTFDGILPPLMRLSTLMRLSCEECVNRFGRQSVDIVFEQILEEPFSMGKGKNRTGFIADFSFIFTPTNYQKYLERATLRRQKKMKGSGLTVESTQQQPLETTPEDRDTARREELMKMIDTWKQNPAASCRYTVIGAHNNGELQRLGITIPTALAHLIPANPNQIPAKSQ